LCNQFSTIRFQIFEKLRRPAPQSPNTLPAYQIATLRILLNVEKRADQTWGFGMCKPSAILGYTNPMPPYARQAGSLPLDIHSQE
jgi:hypothetical protein